MPSLSTKADPSFFRKIVIGAVGARAVQEDLGDMGHDLVELENGSAGAKIWKDVKRKRVRIPDLVCKKCGQRIESRAKTSRELKMSHGNEAERSWDFGLIDDDLIAFPICNVKKEDTWTSSDFDETISYYHNRDRALWKQEGIINYFEVSEFRSTKPTDKSKKGVAEGSETSLEWDAVMSPRYGIVYDIDDEKGIGIERTSDENRHRWKSKGYDIKVEEKDNIEKYEVIASELSPAGTNKLVCSDDIGEEDINEYLDSSERTLRFAGIKIARIRSERGVSDRIREIREDSHEDLYNRIEAAVYLTKVKGDSVRDQFSEFLQNNDPQIRLESVVGLAEVKTSEAVSLLSEILNDSAKEFYLRSAAAWALGKAGTDDAAETLIDAFADADIQIKEDALDALDTIGANARGQLVEGVMRTDAPVAAGSAEILRRQSVSEEQLSNLLEAVREDPEENKWSLWTLAHLPKSTTEAEIAELQDEEPKLHYAVSVIWSFLDSWISDNWDKNPSASDMLATMQTDSSEANPQGDQLSLLN